MGHSHGGIITSSVKPVENSRGSLIIGYISFVKLTSLALSNVPSPMFHVSECYVETYV
jgi:hypothetical protein